MTDIKQTFDPTPYWEASGRVREILKIDRDAITDGHRAEYASGIEVIDGASEEIAGGATTGERILDNLIRSGQIVSEERLGELRVIEQMLLVDEPVLLQQGANWRVGVVCYEDLYFSRVRRGSYFAPAGDGYQAIPAKSYVELAITAALGRMDVFNITPGSLPPEAGSGIGLPLKSTMGLRGNAPIPLPQGMLDMWEIYDHGNGTTVNEYGGRGWQDAIQVGQVAVETNLGISLEELLEHADNEHILEYVTQPAA